mgnify:CR=1 FL=1
MPDFDISTGVLTGMRFKHGGNNQEWNKVQLLLVFFCSDEGLFLSSRMKMYNKIKSKYHRPFQVIPQLKMKIRPVTFGVQQTAELMMRMVKKKVDVSKFVPEQSLVPEPSVIKMKLLEKTIRECEAEKSKLEQQLQSDDGVNDSKKRKRTEKLEKVNEQIRKKQKQSDDRLRIDTTKKKSTKKTKKQNKPYYERLSKQQWVAIVPHVFHELFHAPRKIKKTLAHVVTTDGVSASWHMPGVSDRTPDGYHGGISKDEKEIPVIRELPSSGQMGLHGEDCYISKDSLVGFIRHYFHRPRS